MVSEPPGGAFLPLCFWTLTGCIQRPGRKSGWRSDGSSGSKAPICALWPPFLRFVCPFLHICALECALEEDSKLKMIIIIFKGLWFYLTNIRKMCICNPKFICMCVDILYMARSFYIVSATNWMFFHFLDIYKTAKVLFHDLYTHTHAVQEQYIHIIHYLKEPDNLNKPADWGFTFFTSRWLSTSWVVDDSAVSRDFPVCYKM